MADSWIAEMQAALDAGADPVAVQAAASSGTSPEITAALAAIAEEAAAEDAGISFTATGTGWGSSIGPGGANNWPTPVPLKPLALTAAMTPTTLDTPGASPVATGFPLFQETFNMLLQADEARRMAVDQQISIANLFVELERVSPTRAADLAVKLGLPNMEPDLMFANLFAEDANATFGGKAGSQDLTLPWSFSGSQLSWLQNRPNVSNVLGDIGERFGRPDLFKESVSSLIPSSGALTSLAW